MSRDLKLSIIVPIYSPVSDRWLNSYYALASPLCELVLLDFTGTIKPNDHVRNLSSHKLPIHAALNYGAHLSSKPQYFMLTTTDFMLSRELINRPANTYEYCWLHIDSIDRDFSSPYVNFVGLNSWMLRRFGGFTASDNCFVTAIRKIIRLRYFTPVPISNEELILVKEPVTSLTG